MRRHERECGLCGRAGSPASFSAVAYGYLWVCLPCSQRRPPGLGRDAAEAPGRVQLYPRVAQAAIVNISERGIEVQVDADDATQGPRCMLWADLLPIDKPALSAAAARVRWRFHCVDVQSRPSEWRSGRDNCWELGTSSSGRRAGPAPIPPRWHTGHLEVAMTVSRPGTCGVQLAHPGGQGLQLLRLGPSIDICLEHRGPGALAAFHHGPGPRGSCGGPALWPSCVDEWPSEQAYVDAWRRLCFMEAATNAVTENDSKLLGGVDVRWITTEDGEAAGVFSLPVDLQDAHNLRMRANDLLCIRWHAPRGALVEVARTRPALIAQVFARLDHTGTGFLSAEALLPFAEHTGFRGDTTAWLQEFAGLCRELGCDPVWGVDRESFAAFVSDMSAGGCYCSDDELLAFANPDAVQAGRHVAEEPTWVAHGLVEVAEKLGDEVQIRFKLHPRAEAEARGGNLGPPGPASARSGGVTCGCMVELIPLPESYHCTAAALSDLPLSRPLVRDLVLRGAVERLEVDRRDPQDLIHFKLNESQEEAVRAAHSNPATLIHGPPGTGKTRTAAALALTFARRNAAKHAQGCVLYAATGNKAVDVAVEAISELCVERLEDLFQAQAAEDEMCCICWQQGCNVMTFCAHVFHHHCLMQALRAAPRGMSRTCPICRAVLKSLDGVRLVRVYSSDTERLEFPVPKKYEYQGVRERPRRSVPEPMRRFALHWRVHNKVPGHHNPFAADCAAAYEALLEEGANSPSFDAARARYTELRQKARGYELTHSHVLLTTSCSCRRSWLSQLLQQEGVELRQVIVDEAGTTTEPEALCPLTLARDAEHIVLVGDYRQLRPVIRCRDAAALGLGRSLFERLATKIEAQADAAGSVAVEAADQPAHDRAPAAATRAELVQLVFDRLDRLSTGRLGLEGLRPFADFTGFKGGDFEWLQEYEGWCRHLGCETAVGIGLEAFRRAVDDESEEGCFCSDEELRELAGLPATDDQSPLSVVRDPCHGLFQPPASVLLRQQYRMHPSMNAFPSRQFYGGQVRDDDSTLQRPAGLLVHPRTRSRCATLFWCTPADFEEEVHEVATRDASTRSKANPQEADRCAQLAVRLASIAGPRKVAVLSWYNAQVTDLKRRIQAHPGCESLHVGSVVTAQGSEWDYVLLSTVRSAPAVSRGERAGRPPPLGCLADRHLLNVAVTRGRLGIVVLGNPDALCSNRHWDAFLKHCQP